MVALIQAASGPWLAQAGALIVGIQRDEYGFAITLQDQPDLLDIPGFYQAGRGGFWVALMDDVVVGTIGLKDIGDNTLALRKMFVAPAHRGGASGVAAGLLQTAVDWSRQNVVREILLGTTERFRAAHRFYEKHGFTRIQKAALPPNFPFMPADTRFYSLQTKGQQP